MENPTLSRDNVGIHYVELHVSGCVESVVEVHTVTREGDMSDSPKPPDGYATWLDWHLAGPFSEEQDALRAVCRAELAALRADREMVRDALQVAVDYVPIHFANWHLVVRRELSK